MPSMPSSILSIPMASIGVPTEIKADELRVALTPDGVKELVTQGLEVQVQAGAGVVADSVPKAEYQETLNKARGLLKALACLDIPQP